MSDLVVRETAHILLDALYHTGGFIFGVKKVPCGILVLEIRLQRFHRQCRRMRGESLYAQAAIQIGSQKFLDPTCILAANFLAVIAHPQSNYGDQSRFLLGNHDQAARESGYILESSRERGRNGGLHSTSFLRLGHKLHTQSGHRWRNRRGQWRALSASKTPGKSLRRVS